MNNSREPLRGRARLRSNYLLLLCGCAVLISAAFARTPGASLVPSSLTFAPQLTGTTSPPQSVTLTNSGTSSLTIKDIVTTSSYEQTNTCPASLAAGASCSISVTFSPRIRGTITGTLTVSDNASGGKQTVALSGTGTVINLVPSSLNFGSEAVGMASAAQTITVTNTGTAKASQPAISIQGANASDFAQTNTCGTLILPGASCMINVTFTPAASGARSATLNFSITGGGNPAPVNLSGTGVTPTLSYTPSTLSFPSQFIGTISAAQVVTIMNTGVVPVSLSSVSLTGMNSSSFLQTNTCTGTLAVNASCTISVQFAPAAHGDLSAGLLITDNAMGSPQSVGLSGICPNALAIINQPLVPTSTPAGTSGLTLTVNGTAFASGAFVLWNGSARATTYMNSTLLTAQILSTDLSTAATAEVTVLNPEPGGGASNPEFFQITSPTPVVTTNRTDNPVGTNPRGVISADFNGDTIPDLAIVNRDSNTVSILLGKGDGTFLPAVSYATGTDPIALASCDFNGDGHPDLVIANRASYTVSILLGNGDGTFQNHVDYPAGTEPIAVATGDFNGDGFLDVAVANSGSGTVSIFFGTGTGALQAAAAYGVGASPLSLVAADLNGDGYLDLAVADSGSNDVALLLGNQNGTFQPAIYFDGGLTPTSIVTADFNHDSQLDLALADNGGNSVSILLNQGHGAFSPPVSYPVGNQPFSLAAGDFLGNGNLSLAVTNFADNTVSILPGNGDGTFDVSLSTAFNAGTNPIGLATGDFNRDGRADLAASNSVSNTASVFLQSPLGILAPISAAFGTQTLGASGPAQTISLTNSGSALLTITGVSITGANSGDFAETSQCGTSLAPGASCSFSVTFSPLAPGARIASLTILGNASPGLSVPLTGLGAGPVTVFSSSALVFSGQTAGTTSAPQALTLLNNGTTSLLISGISASGNFAQTNTCGGSLAPAAMCTISVTFTPPGAGSYSGSITITDSALGSPQQIALSGTGTGVPVAVLAPGTLTFGNQPINTSSQPQTIVLSNTGAGPLTISSITVGTSYAISSTCGSSLGAGANCTISVTFQPNNTGAHSASVVVADNSAGGTQSSSLTGTGTAAVLSFSPTYLLFSSQAVGTSSSSRVVNLTNTTGAPLTITSITSSGDYSQTNNCPATLSPGAGCGIHATFSPTATGTRPGTIVVADNAADSPQVVPLSGTGIAPAVALAPASLAFPGQNVGSASAPGSVTLTNNGTGALTLTGISISGTNGGDFSESNTCGTSLAAGASCAISAIFMPTAAGSRSANLMVSDNAPGSPQMVPLAGTGLAASLVLSPTAVAFGNQSVGTASTAYPVTLTNTGTAVLTITGITVTGANSGDFSLSSTCGAALAAASTCTASVVFTPAASGSRAASLLISDTLPGSPQSAGLSGTGTAPSVSLTASSLTFASQGLGTSSPASGVTIFNTGNGSLAISSIAITGANSGDFSQSNDCGTLLAAGGNCTIDVVFTPTALGTRSASLGINDNAPGSPQTVLLSGTAVSSNQTASLSPTSLTFASQTVGTTSAAQTVTLTNSGGEALTIASIVASGDFAQTNTCGSSLAPGVSCTIQVTFMPTAAGTRTGYVTFSDNDPSALQTVNLTGTGAASSASVVISPREGSATPGQSLQYSALLNGNSASFTWAVDGVTGGTSSSGTISSTGLYTAPIAAGLHTITATSQSDPPESASVPVTVTSYAGTFVYHNDDGRTGQNLSETVLNTGNVNSTQFGKLFSYPVDGDVYAEPLYVQGVNIPGVGIRNVVFVVTENDSIFAFDADGLSSTPLWQVSFINPSAGITTLADSDVGGCDNITPEIGITSTPVIDPASNTIFLVARTKVTNGSNVSYVQSLHALNLATGEEMPGSPVVISGSVTVNGITTTFNPQLQNQRSGLFLLNGIVYISWGSHCDIKPYSGWIMGYDEVSLQQSTIYCVTPNGTEGGIWQSGGAPAVDSSGYIYYMSGNGTFDADTNGPDYGISLVKVIPSGNSLAPLDYFTPSNYASLNESDLDLGSGGPLILPDQPSPPTELLVAAGKEGAVYLADRTNLGKYNSGANQVLQCLPAGTVLDPHSMPAYWLNNVYFAGVSDTLKSFRLSGGLLSTTPISQSSNIFGYPGATASVSANGASNGVLWIIDSTGYSTSGFAVLYAYDASNVSRQIYSTRQNFSRDHAGIAVKFSVPTVANGKVYVGTHTELDVYGLLP